MAFHFLIDGYNLLYALPELPPGSLQDKRESLIRMLRQRRLQGNNQMTVVFDSREGEGSRSHQRDLTVVFTAGETADEWISSHVRQAAQPQAMVVVSNDQGIRADVKGTGVRFMTSDDFLRSARVDASPRTTPNQTHPENDEITEEFRKKWL